MTSKLTVRSAITLAALRGREQARTDEETYRLRRAQLAKKERYLVSASRPPRDRNVALRRVSLDASVVRAGLATVLEAFGAPAFVVHEDGRVEHASTSGAALLARDAVGTRARVREVIAEDGDAARHPEESVPERFIVVLRERAREEAAPDANLPVASRAWSLTRREIDVLRRLVVGDSNKEIGEKLRCSEVSVERHVTSLLRKSRCDSRARLVARFWTGL